MKKVVWFLSVAVVIGGMVSTAWGQYRVEQGRVLDASNRVGSGGLNAPRRAYDFNAGNRIVTGNVPLGRGFRGFSPITDPRTFGLGSSIVGGGFTAVGSGLLGRSVSALPSDQLTPFQRDSYNLADFQRYRLGLRGSGNYGAYYSPYSTMTDMRTLLRGGYRPGTSQLLNPYQVPPSGFVSAPTDPLAEARRNAAGPLSVPTRLIRAGTGQTVAGQVNRQLLSTPLFRAAFREVPVTELADRARQGEGEATAGMGPAASLMGPVEVRSSRSSLLGGGSAQAAAGRQGVSGRLANVLARASREEAMRVDGGFGGGRGAGGRPPGTGGCVRLDARGEQSAAAFEADCRGGGGEGRRRLAWIA